MVVVVSVSAVDGDGDCVAVGECGDVAAAVVRLKRKETKAKKKIDITSPFDQLASSSPLPSSLFCLSVFFVSACFI